MNANFKFDGHCDDYKKIVSDITWFIGNVLDKGIEEVSIEVTEGPEKDYISGLIVDSFSETGVKLNLS